MGSDKTLRSAWVAGLCFIATSIFMLEFSSLVPLSSRSAALPLLLIATVTVYVATLAWHTHGFVELGRRHGSMLLTRSAQSVIAGLILFGISVITSLLYGSVFTDAAVGLTMVILCIPTLVFVFALLRLYGTLGIWSIIAAGIIPTAVIFIWHPWPVALVVALSTYFFYREQ